MAEEIINGTGTEGNEGGAGSQQETKTYTAEEVARLVQAESDRRTNQALAKQKKEYEKKLSLQSLDEQQRKEAESQMKIQELQEQLAQFQIEKNKSELKSVLSSRGLSAEFADIINIGEDIEEAQAMIDKLDKLFKASVKAEVEKRLAANGGAPRSSSTTGEITKETFKAMSLSQQAAIARDNRELYNRLTQN